MLRAFDNGVCAVCVLSLMSYFTFKIIRSESRTSSFLVKASGTV